MAKNIISQENPRPDPTKFTLKDVPEGITFNHRNLGRKKVLYLPLNARLGSQEATAVAFVKAGFDLCILDYLRANRPNRYFIRIAELFKPDWIHMQLQFTNVIRPETVKTIKEMLPNTIITNWTGDARKEAKQEFVDISEFTTMSLISSEGQLDMYREAGCHNVEYWQIGVDARKFRPLPKNTKKKLKKRYRQRDIVFCANVNPAFPGAQLRIDVAEALSAMFPNFTVYGSKAWKNYLVNYKGSIRHAEQNLVYNAALIVISINNFNDIPMYFSGRQLIAMATGRLVISKYIPGLEKYFKNKHHLAWFETPQQCVRLVEHYMSYPKEAEIIGENARKEILENHTFDVRVEELARRLDLK